MQRPRRAEVSGRDLLLVIVGIVIIGLLFPYIKAGLSKILPQPPTLPGEEWYASQVEWDFNDAMSDGAASPSSVLLWVNDPQATGAPISASISTNTATFNGKFADGDSYLLKYTGTEYTTVFSGTLTIFETSDGKCVQGTHVVYDSSDGTDTSLNMWYGSTDLDDTTDASPWDIAASTKYSGINIQFDGSSMSDERYGNDYWDPDGKQYTYKTWLVIQNNGTGATLEFGNLDMWKHWTEGTTEYWAAIIPPGLYVYNDADLDDDGYQNFLVNIEFGSDQVNKFQIDFYDDVSVHDAENNNFGTADETEYIYTS